MSTTIRLPSATREPGGHELLRDVNRRVRELLKATETQAYFFCECVDESCAAALRMSGSEYDALSREPNCYAVLVGHDDRDLDVVVARNDRYAIVRSEPAGAAAGGR